MQRELLLGRRDRETKRLCKSHQPCQEIQPASSSPTDNSNRVYPFQTPHSSRTHINARPYPPQRHHLLWALLSPLHLHLYPLGAMHLPLRLTHDVSNPPPPKHPLHAPPQPPITPYNLPRQTISKPAKRLTLPLQKSIIPSQRLHKLAIINIRIASLVDIVYDFGGKLGGGEGVGGGREGGEGGCQFVDFADEDDLGGGA